MMRQSKIYVMFLSSCTLTTVAHSSPSTTDAAVRSPIVMPVNTGFFSFWTDVDFLLVIVEGFIERTIDTR